MTSKNAAEDAQWLRPWVVAAVGVLSLATIITAFAEDMPDSHHTLVPIAVVVMLAAWAIELFGLVRSPRLVLVALVVVTNVWLTLIGHASVNYFFLMLVLAWVAVVGSPLDRALTLVLCFGTVAIGLAVDIAERDGYISWSTWTAWSIGLLLIWGHALLLRRQTQLVTELRLLRAQTEQRNRELDTLLTVSRSVASTLDMNRLLDAVLDALGSVVEYTATAILTIDEAGTTLSFAHWRGPASFRPNVARDVTYNVATFEPFWSRLAGDEPIAIRDVRDDSPEALGFRRLVGESEVDTTYGFANSLMWIPLVVGGRALGILSIASSTRGAFGPHEATLALAIARQAAIAIENARLHERARQAAVLEERQRLARELHDSVTQALYGVSLYAEAANRALAAGDAEPAADNVRQILETTAEALGEMRLLLYELRPPILEEYGLAAALQARLQAVEARAGLEVAFDARGDQRLGADKEQELYRLAQEALNNVVRHAHARHVDVQLDLQGAQASLQITDDGTGFEPSLRGTHGYGLRGMRERVERLSGRLEIHSAPGTGTRVRVDLPR